jgi:dihydroorotate dehydrogenase electron transfer subunit
MVFLAEKLQDAGTNLKDSVACLGGRSAADILCAADFQAMALNTRIATEDGSMGEKGLVTTALSDWLKSNRPDMIYACGPMPMLSAVSAMAKKYQLPCQVSIETIMACGVGACLGCAIKDTDHAEGYGHVCIDGPVFKADRLLDIGG